MDLVFIVLINTQHKIDCGIWLNNDLIWPTAFRLACIQLAVTANKAQNYVRAREKIVEAAKNGAKLIILPVWFEQSDLKLKESDWNH